MLPHGIFNGRERKDCGTERIHHAGKQCWSTADDAIEPDFDVAS